MAKRQKKQFKNMLEGQRNGSAPAEAAALQSVVQSGEQGAVYWVPLEQVAENPYQPRLDEDVEHLSQLAESILSLKGQLSDTLGLQQVPLARVGMMRAGGFEQLGADALQDASQVRAAIAAGAVVQLAFGHSRLTAFKIINQGLGAVFPDLRDHTSGPELDPDYGVFPVRLMSIEDSAMWSHVITENAQRKDLTPMEEAFAIRRALDEFGVTQAQAGEPFGFSRTQVANKLMLLRLPQIVQDRVQSGEFTEAHGRALAVLSPAPDLLDSVLAELDENNEGQTPTTREIQTAVDWKLRHATMPISVKPVQTVSLSGSAVEFKLDWPEDWEPKEEAEGVRGACAGCSMRVKFGKEKFDRCIALDCYGSKSKLWDKLKKEHGDGVVDEEQASNTLLGRAEQKNGKAKLDELPEDERALTGSAIDPVDEERKRLRERLKQMPILERRAMLAVMNEVW